MKWPPVRPLILGIGLIVALSTPGGAQTTDTTTPETQQTQALSLFEQAERHHAGDGVLQNFQTAAELYRQAATLGHTGSQNRLGRYYHAGLGVPQDYDTALRWLRLAAADDNAEHVFDLAKALEGGSSAQQAEAAELYQQAADARHMEAMVNLGVLYQDGIGVTQDLPRALALYQEPAAAGHARAQNNLGLLYTRGENVPQDYTRAAALFQAAADQGLPTAMTNLSVMYANGFGVDQSDAKADYWARQASQIRQDASALPASTAEPVACVFDPRMSPPPSDAAALADLSRSADAGDPVAQFLIGWLFCAQPSPSISDLRQAAQWFTAAADNGHGPSMVNMGQFYLQGLGVPQDYVLAYMWLLLANSAGQSDVLSQSAALQQRMTAIQINEAQDRAARKWRGQAAR